MVTTDSKLLKDNLVAVLNRGFTADEAVILFVQGPSTQLHQNFVSFCQ